MSQNCQLVPGADSLSDHEGSEILDKKVSRLDVASQWCH